MFFEEREMTTLLGAICRLDANNARERVCAGVKRIVERRNELFFWLDK